MNATRSLEEVEVPAAGTWAIDPGHAEVGFVGRHFGLTKVRGRFTGIDGAVKTLGEQPFGQVLLVLAGVGIALYGLYAFVLARHARM